MSKVIMLACAGGMSTSLLVTKMEKAAKRRNVDVSIFATAGSTIPDECKKYSPDVILLGPQIQYLFKLVVKEVDVPVAVIGMKDFGTMDGEKVLDLALSMIK
ncbi:PTS sugar transporter subunit IIB [Companilactobacillus futsaii]|uniref:PTS sugar transporter subunit IIB n=2 Tax=Companilactobacillus futsaii TaxID=938155 RepID=A0A5B7SYD6_9LACO|nr:PTS sugar transporter subunit IIB [Companilactobacillus futsaii]KRK92839.1 phosphoenolpyruvate-dependent sugar phosphotransferase system EIIB, lactose cellobiose specific [Companilactobacillus futsaii JCM 17355]QCX24648.1 PTS sugar transporter subunit IIB [Companilactobacillus futsaii]